MSLGLASATFLLSACGSNKKEPQAKASGPQPMEEVKKEAAQLERPQPGQYRQAVEITRFAVPGMPAQAADQMKKMMSAKRENVICLTKADTEKGFRDMFKDVGKGNQCSYSRFDVSGGKIDAQMDCAAPQERSARMTIKGMVTPNGSDVTVDMDVKGGKQPMGNMQMTMHMKSERVGDCVS